ncbi:GTP pyrophosphokinase [Aureibacillus halotolerans]|uniref:Putative GTP pyrophosphokinase n=1 Tax=Aureibacillus halotolerans TaxID=1508390 RepID=A0A4V3D5Y6_9BACI|nr:GTP pyrophosphokinase family protein [Aureibacillus halotolerans]TDQ41987.1 putative GTP pyrophosphokinase [Aureibacillus halotolerans]
MTENPISKELKKFSAMKEEVTRFLMVYKFALDQMNTKIEVLQEEFQYIHDHNPIEHTKSRLKSPESLLRKMHRKNLDLSLANAKQHIHDIAGLRITCSFISDIYAVRDMLQNQKDVKLIETKDYISQPKSNGYQSLHLLLEIPVFMSDRTEHVCVEVQIRTVAMDFWASLEHKLYYKFNKAVPSTFKDELKSAADQVNALDRKMERIHQDMRQREEVEQGATEVIDMTTVQIPHKLLSLFEETRKE